MRTLTLLAIAAILNAQDAAPPRPATLSEAVAAAVARYPAVRVSQEQLAAAAAGIALARTSYLPRVDSLAQINRATRNNVFGLLFPQSVIPSISGPVLNTNNLTNVWGSAVGVLVSWEPFDFGFRQANVNVSEAGRKRAEAGVKRTQFEVGTLAADAYLTLLAAEEMVKAAQAGVDRARSIQQVIGAVVRADLRPGADLSRAEAESALAQTQLIQAKQAVDVARATLAQFTGTQLAAMPLAASAPGVEVQPVANHPRATEQTAAIDEVKAREKALDRSYYPKFNLQGSAYARGTGANIDGTTGRRFLRLRTEHPELGSGLHRHLPADGLPCPEGAQADRGAQRTHRIREARPRSCRTSTRSSPGPARMLNGARLVVQNTPVQLRAARAAEQQAAARYKAGLSSVIDVAEAERLLTQTEIDDALARLNVWRAELAVAAAAGDMDTFLASVKQ